jgi:hypothetical protein
VRNERQSKLTEMTVFSGAGACDSSLDVRLLLALCLAR